MVRVQCLGETMATVFTFRIRYLVLLLVFRNHLWTWYIGGGDDNLLLSPPTQYLCLICVTWLFGLTLPQTLILSMFFSSGVIGLVSCLSVAYFMTTLFLSFSFLYNCTLYFHLKLLCHFAENIGHSLTSCWCCNMHV